MTREPHGKRTKVKDLVLGDRVSVDGQEFVIHSVQRLLLFDGNTWEVFIQDGPNQRRSLGTYNGNDITSVAGRS